MKVSNFITLFNVKTKNGELSQKDLIDVIVELIKPKSYLPYDKKIQLAVDTINDSEVNKPSAPYRNRLFIINLIRTYTDLEVTVQDFDVLSQNMLIVPILSTFENEYKICSSIMNMCLDEIGGVQYV